MAGRVYAVPVLPPQSNFGGSQGDQNPNAPAVRPSETIKQFWQFVQDFRVNESWIYRSAALHLVFTWIYLDVRTAEIV